MMKMKIMWLSLRRGLSRIACTVHTEVGFALDVVAQPLDLAQALLARRVAETEQRVHAHADHARAGCDRYLCGVDS